MTNNIHSLMRIGHQLSVVLSKSQKIKALFVLLSMLILSLLDLLSVSSIYPLLTLLTDSERIDDAWYVNLIYDTIGKVDHTTLLIIFCVIIVLSFIFKNAFAILLSYIQQRFGTSYLREKSTLILDIYMQQPYEYYLNTNSSKIQRGVYGDVSSSYQMLISIFQIVGDLLAVIAIAVFLFFTDWMISLGALGIGICCFFFIVLGFKNKTKEAGKLRREAEFEQVMTSYQAINAIKEITVLGRRGYFVDKFKNAASKLEKATLVYTVINACPDRILEGVCISGFILIVLFRIILSSDVSSFIPILGTFAMATFRILPSIAKVSNRINALIFHQFGLQNCYNVISGTGLYELDEPLKEFSVNSSAIISPDVCFNGISIKNISFRYWKSNENVISDLSLEIRRGESVALIGSSGAGKTTLADIILGLLEPQKGVVEIDGISIFDEYSKPHSVIGYVPQSVYLIDDTIKANVAFGIPDDRISEERIINALHQAQLFDFVESLPAGLNTLVGECGVKLSGGQRQRIALARALYEDPEILILDEATSALDTETETAVMESIEALQGKKTLIIVAHRLSTIKNCDRIYEIINGKAVERSHSEVFGD